MLIRNQDGPDPREDDDLEDGPPAQPDGDDEGQGGEAAEVDDEPEEEPSEEDGPELEDEPQPPPRRAKGPTKEENFAAMRERIRLQDEELARLRGGQQQPAQQPRQQEDPRAEAERLSRMTPEQRIQHFAAVAEERITRATAIGEFQAADNQDRATFAARVVSDPRAAKYANEVEARLLQLRKQGANASREDVLKYIIGERVMANAPKVRQQQKAAAETVRRQTTTPERPKGDTGGKPRQGEKAARAKRLEGMRI